MASLLSGIAEANPSIRNKLSSIATVETVGNMAFNGVADLFGKSLFGVTKIN